MTDSFPVPPAGSSSSPVRAPKRRDSLRLEILSSGACLPLFDGNRLGPFHTSGPLAFGNGRRGRRGGISAGLLLGRLLDYPSLLQLLLGDLRWRRHARGYLLWIGDERYTLRK